MLRPAPECPVEINEDLVKSLIGSQCPQWAHLPIQPVAQSGWDNRTFHLGEALMVRLPSAQRYVAQVAKEHRFLPELKSRLPFEIPTPVFQGEPGHGYPWPWSVYAWIPGENPTPKLKQDVDFAHDVAVALNQLHGLREPEGPMAGRHNFYRGGALNHYDQEVRDALNVLTHRVNASEVRALWSGVLNEPYQGEPVWVHGDVSPGNLLIREDAFAALIDFGSCGMGDPACDLVMAYTFFEGEARRCFIETLQRDDSMWLRAKGWVLWKALITLAQSPGHKHNSAQQVLNTLFNPVP